MKFCPENKTKIICTIGPSSNSISTLENLLRAGMNVARLNFSHGDMTGHRQVIKNIREASFNIDIPVAIMADLPGLKIRIGQLATDPLQLMDGDNLTLTTEDIVGDKTRISVNFSTLPNVLSIGDDIYINDGFVQLKVTSIVDQDIHCKIFVGGELNSRKGLNLPGIELDSHALTENDKTLLTFALENQVDAVSQSFVSNANDIYNIKQFISDYNKQTFVIAKIERLQALKNIDQIIQAADGIMIARGDLGVEIPIEEMAVTQKKLVQLANAHGKPVITATHMLESMVSYRRPTRAEATDVANAILDGTDCIMLSSESAMGKYPVEATNMLAKIATYTEPFRSEFHTKALLKEKLNQQSSIDIDDLIASNIQYAIDRVKPAAVLIPTLHGTTARNISKYRVPIWITAFSLNEHTCKTLQFSYGVFPVFVNNDVSNWEVFCFNWLEKQDIKEGIALLTQGPSEYNQAVNHRIEVLDLNKHNQNN